MTSIRDRVWISVLVMTEKVPVFAAIVPFEFEDGFSFEFEDGLRKEFENV